MLLLSFAVIIAGYLFGLLISPLFEKKKIYRSIYIFSFTFANFAFMGYPIMGAVFGQDSLLTLTLFNIPLYLIVNVLGLYIFTDKNAEGQGSKQKWLTQLKVVLNPVTICIFIGILLSFLHFQYPPLVSEVIDMATVCITPLSMLLTGFLLGGAFLARNALRSQKLYCFPDTPCRHTSRAIGGFIPVWTARLYAGGSCHGFRHAGCCQRCSAV